MPDEAIVLVRGYLNRQRGRQRERWLSAIRGAGFRGEVYEFVWDASSPWRFAANLWRYRDWHATAARARRVGRYALSARLGRLPHARVDLVGASAGAALVFHALGSPLLQPGKVRSAWLLGAALATDRCHSEWQQVLARVEGRVHNVYCANDVVLATVFAAVTGASACGAGPVTVDHPRFFNWDASPWVGGSRRSMASHANYALALSQLLVRETKSG